VSIGESELYAAPLDGKWAKSSYSEGDGPDCVELMCIAGGVAVRDSKRHDAGVLRFDRSFIRQILEGL
jgi:hypothetical protein